MLRETFAVRYVQAGGSPSQLRKGLGLDAKTPVVRYQKGNEQGKVAWEQAGPPWSALDEK